MVSALAELTDTMNVPKQFLFLPLFYLLFLLPTVFLTAQDAATPITLREAPAGSTAQRHLLQSVYENVTYPPKAREARRSGTYALTIIVDENGSTFRAMPLSELPGDSEVTNFVIQTSDDTEGATVSGLMKVAADRALIEETEKMGRFLVDLGFEPATRGGVVVADSLNLVFYFKIQE